jgi:hypothetical protein
VPVQALVFKPKGWLETLYEELCSYTHSRPDSSDGGIWRSNGPIYVWEGFNLVFKLQASTYAACYVLTKVGRPRFALPKGSKFLFETPELLWHDDIASSFRTLCSRSKVPVKISQPPSRNG